MTNYIEALEDLLDELVSEEDCEFVDSFCDTAIKRLQELKED